MKPKDFYTYIYGIAKEVGITDSLFILGGDHLGPLTWTKEPEASAMEKSMELVRQYVLAGFTKIHLDTSMKLQDDALDAPLSKEVIARRGVTLYKTCMEAYAKRKEEYPDAIRPVFIIGSEVPIPGGSQEAEESIQVTTAEDFIETVEIYKKAFSDYGCAKGFQDVVAVVVQPGVEFGDAIVHEYVREKASHLSEALTQYEGLVFEGHSTDYQCDEKLKEMTEDGIAILKVGPALTFQLREALFALSFIEKELISEKDQSHFMEVLEQEMMESPENWEKHYKGSEKEQELARKYSFSDRCRYYIGNERVVSAIEKLLHGLREVEIPLSLLRQFMPLQYQWIMENKMQLSPLELVQMHIDYTLEEYEYATGISK